MATRSDFAQKLLTDLRMRKERMSMPASHSPSNSKGVSRDSNGNPSQQYKGSRQTKSSLSVDNRPTNLQRRSNHGARSLNTDESSKQLVQYGGGRDAKQIGNLSRALEFAFGNNKNFTKLNNSSSNNPILSFLHRMGRRALDIGKTERRNITDFNKPSSQIINVSNFHINEISKGVQKLNQILKGFSNGITFDGYSVEIGRELLKGAMDLEEMLENLQESSEQVISSQRKSRIKLLNEKGEEEEEEENELIPQKKLVKRPRFSFDKPLGNSRNAKQVIKSDPKQSFIALKYTSEEQLSSAPDETYHRRLTSGGPNFRPQKGKIPNVIAKLMGLEEVPHSVNFETTPSQLSSQQKQGMVLKTCENKNGKNLEKTTENAKYLAPKVSGRKVIQNDNNFKFQIPKSLLKDFERVGVTKSVSDPQFTEEFRRFNRSPKELHLKMRIKDTEKHQEDTGVEKGQAKGVVNRNHKHAEAKRIRKGTSCVILDKEKRNTDREGKPRVDAREQLIVGKRNSKEQYENPYKASTNSKHKSLVFLNSCHSGTPRETVPKTKHSRGCIPLINEEKPVDTVSVERVGDHVEIRKREGPQRKDKVITKGNIANTVVTLKDQISVLQKGKHLKLASSIKGEENLSNNNKKSEATAKMLIEYLPLNGKAEELQSQFFVHNLPTLDKSSQDMATKISIDPIDDEDQLASLNEDTYQESQKLKLHSIKGNDELSDREVDELQSPIVFSDLPTLSESSQDMATKISMDPFGNEGQLPNLNEDKGMESQKIELHSENAKLENSNPQQHEQKEKQFPENNELLIESEIHLKQTLLKSRLFHNTAEALFNLSIAVDFLHPTDHLIQDNDSKLMLDCAYEVTRKKGKRLELSPYPSHKISTSSIKVDSFDDLVKQLNKEFEKLKVTYKGTSEEPDSTVAIQEMLERDVEYRETDLNAMWDLGWNEVMFAMIERDELIKDMELYLIDGVIEDIAKELLHLHGYL